MVLIPCDAEKEDERVKVTAAPLVEGVTGLELNTPLTPVGSEVRLIVTGDEKPFRLVRVRVILTEPPWANVEEDEAAVREKS